MITTLGCCDSGIGGMITVHALHQAYPNLNIVFVADQKHAPYGDKSVEQLEEYRQNIFENFNRMNIDEIVIACNTLCSYGISDIQKKYPQMKLHTIIEPTCKQLKGYDFKTINVLATNYTVKKHVYGKYLEEMFPNATIREMAAPKLVPIIENGCDYDKLKEAVDEYCQSKADAWVLGCTHYPLIRPLMKDDDYVFDSIAPIVNMFKGEEIIGEGKVVVYTSGDPNLMRESIKKILNYEYDVYPIQLERL
ncbi:MAG: glutamate racemase [Traorella sp.]